MALRAKGVTGDVDTDLHHQLGIRQRDVQLLTRRDPDGILDGERWIEWRGGLAHQWSAA